MSVFTESNVLCHSSVLYVFCLKLSHWGQNM